MIALESDAHLIDRLILGNREGGVTRPRHGFGDVDDPALNEAEPLKREGLDLQAGLLTDAQKPDRTCGHQQPGFKGRSFRR